MPKLKVRKGMPSVQLSRAEFAKRFRDRFYDPAFAGLDAELGQVIDTAWNAYDEYRKSPRTRPAGRGFVDPAFEVPIEWLDTRRSIEAAERRQKDPKSPSRILLINGSSRSDQSCPGEMSKTFRLVDAGTRCRSQNPRLRGRPPRPQPPRPPNTAASSIPARPASRPRCRSATGRAPAIPITRWDRSTTGWPRSTRNGLRRTA